MTTNPPPLSQVDIDWTRAKEIFTDVLEVPFPDRNDMLRRAVGHDRCLRQVVARLLSAHDTADSFLDESEGDPSSESES